MKYAITGPMGRIHRILDEPTDRTVEITDEQAALVNDTPHPMGYFVIEGQFKTGVEVAAERQAARRAEMEAARIAAMTPEQLAEQQARAQRQAAYDAAAAVFESLPIGKQAMWEPVRAAVAQAIMAGDMAKALEILTTLPVLYDGAEEDRQLFLDLINAL